MQENMILRIAFVDFLKQMQPLVIDPLLIVQSHFKNFTKLLSDNSITTKTILEFIEKLKFKPQSEKISTEKINSTEPKSQPQSQQIPAIPVNKITQPAENKPTHRRCVSNQIDLISQRYKTDLTKKIEIPQPEKLDNVSIIQVSKPSLTQFPFQFNKFLTIQEDKKFSLVAKEYILDDIEIAIKEFRRNTKTMLCLTEKTSEVNTSESNEVDKTLKKQDYDFSSYMEKQQQHQKQTYNQLRNETGFNILSKYKKIDKGL